MAVKQASSMSKTIYQGAQGNLSLIHDTVTLADAIGDVTEIRELPVGTTITGVRVISADSLGAASTVQVAVGETDLTEALDSAAALNESVHIKPIYLSETANLSIKTAGGATAGEVTVCLEYKFTGY